MSDPILETQHSLEKSVSRLEEVLIEAGNFIRVVRPFMIKYVANLPKDVQDTIREGKDLLDKIDMVLSHHRVKVLEAEVERLKQENRQLRKAAPKEKDGRSQKRPNVPYGAKLDTDKVREMRKLHKQGEPIPEIAKAFGVDPRTAQMAIDKTTWKSVKDED